MGWGSLKAAVFDDKQAREGALFHAAGGHRHAVRRSSSRRDDRRSVARFGAPLAAPCERRSASCVAFAQAMKGLQS